LFWLSLLKQNILNPSKEEEEYSVSKQAELLARRPANVKKLLGSASIACPLNSKDILSVIKGKHVILMACNTRIKHVVPGIMRAAAELDAIVGFEMAKSEGDIDGGYTGQDPKTFFETIVGYAEDIGFGKPFFIHGDHITVKNASDKEVESARKLIAAELEHGYTSFAIDASFNLIPDNIRITTDLAQPIIEAGMGLEVEVGEVGPTGKDATLTTVKEAVDFISGLNANDIHPHMLAINNGSKHGNYLAGEKIFIDLERTGEIYNAVRKYGVVIAQHGITGTPVHLIGRFSEYGIRKGNVGTQWQNIAHEGLPQDLMEEMKDWSQEMGKNIKMATKSFKDKIDNIPQANKDAIANKAYEEAKILIKAFKAEGTATMVLEGL
jgi:fructose-bisphosphate aldolase class II